MNPKPLSSAIYEPLDPSARDVRLFQLLPGSDPERISGILDFRYTHWTRKTTTSPHVMVARHTGTVKMRLGQLYYEALSYEWGDSNGPKHTILVNGQPVQIRDNLFYALLSLRAMSVFEPLWIDALCINQDDVQERNHQVGMMDLVYKSAGKVRVWLGRENASIAQAFDVLARLVAAAPKEAKLVVDQNYKSSQQSHRTASQHRSSCENYRIKQRITQRALTDLMLPFLKSISNWEWDCLILLVKKSYWTRIWIIQEYILARDVILCSGKNCINSEALELAIEGMHILNLEHPSRLLSAEQEAVWEVLGAVGTRIIEMRIFRKDLSLIELLESTKESKCHDPRDRIYAITALAEDISSFHDTIPIDYARSIFKTKMDIAWAVQMQSRFSKDYVSRLCSLLDEIFADCPDDE